LPAKEQKKEGIVPAVEGERKEENPARHHFPSNNQRALIVLKRLPKLHPNHTHPTANAPKSNGKANTQPSRARATRSPSQNGKQKANTAEKIASTPKNNQKQQKTPNNPKK